MKVFFRKALPVIGFICADHSLVHGQAKAEKFEFGVAAGLFLYQGDLTPTKTGSYKTPGPAIQLSASRVFTSSFSFRAQISWGNLKGNDSRYEPEWRKERNFNFQTPLVELSGVMVWQAPDLVKNLRPYVLAGAGLSYLNIHRDYSRFNTEFFSTEPSVLSGLAVDAAHATPRVLPVVPIGAGLRYQLKGKFSITAESIYRITNTDYLDGFSHAANPALKDHYISHTLGLLYSPGRKNKLDCPKW
jgi:hypothetical protein